MSAIVFKVNWYVIHFPAGFVLVAIEIMRKIHIRMLNICNAFLLDSSLKSLKGHLASHRKQTCTYLFTISQKLTFPNLVIYTGCCEIDSHITLFFPI